MFARAHHYTLVDRPRVELVSDPAIDRADIVVRARFADPIVGHATGRTAATAPGEPGANPEDVANRHDGVHGPATRGAARPPAPDPAWDGANASSSSSGQTITLGRATDNGLTLVDGRVSRHHGRISVRRGTLVYTDLQSTNGSRVNGTTVEEVVLGVGDRIQLGDTLLVVEAVETIEGPGAH